MTTEGNGQVQDPNFTCEEIGPALEWRPACVSYAVDGRGSQWMDFADVEEAIDLAFEEWENVDCGGGEPPSVVFQPLASSTCRRAEFNCDGNVNTIAFLDPFRDECNANAWPDAAFAVTSVFFNAETGELLDADMQINDQLASAGSAGGPYADCPDDCEDFPSCCPTPVRGPGVADLRSIVTHEIGHMIGIGHSNIREATMFGLNERSSVEKRTLHPDDEDAICTIYPPGSLDQTCDATPFGGLALNCEDKPCNTENCRVSTSSGSCSASGDLASSPLSTIAVALLFLIALRRRSRLARGS